MAEGVFHKHDDNINFPHRFLQFKCLCQRARLVGSFEGVRFRVIFVKRACHNYAIGLDNLEHVSLGKQSHGPAK